MLRIEPEEYRSRVESLQSAVREAGLDHFIVSAFEFIRPGMACTELDGRVNEFLQKEGRGRRCLQADSARSSGDSREGCKNRNPTPNYDSNE